MFGIPVIAEEHSNDLTGFIVTPEHAQDVYDRNIALTDELERLKRDLERCMTMSKPDLGGL